MELTRIFHTDRDEETAKADGVRQTSILTPGCMCPYRPSHNVSLTQDPSDFPVSAGDRCEIFGLTRIFHTDRDEEDAKPCEDHSNLILIGFMGSGKTSMGKQLAKYLKREFIDTDQCIVKKTHRTISQFMEESGEEAFRAIESDVLEELLEKKGREKIVLSTGGGIILNPKNQDLLRQLGIIIWLDATSDKLFERVRRNAWRPLLQVEHPRHTFNQLLSERIKIYEMLSDIKIDTTHLSYTQTLEAIIEKVSFHLIKTINPHISY